MRGDGTHAFLTNRPTAAHGWPLPKAIDIFSIGSTPQRIELKLESGNKLIGTSTVALPASLKRAAQITVQAKFE